MNSAGDLVFGLIDNLLESEFSGFELENIENVPPEAEYIEVTTNSNKYTVLTKLKKTRTSNSKSKQKN